MKRLQRAKSKMLVWLTAFVLAMVSLFAGVNMASIKKASADEMTYIDTEVEAVNVFGGKIFAFVLSESDYASAVDAAGDFPEGSAKYEYIASLTYWKNFTTINSEGARFIQTFAYWNGGIYPHSHIGSAGTNAVAHLTSMNGVEYGVLLQFPAGTTFPSLTYFMNNCQGDPVAYRTKTDVAFYYDGTKFVKTDYAIAEARENATKELDAVDYSLYYEKEQAMVKTLVASTKNELKSCFATSRVEEVMYNLYTALDAINTKADYAALAGEKAVAKAEIATFFDGLAQNTYGEKEAATLAMIREECNDLIDEAENMTAVAEIVAGIKYKAEGVLTEDEKPAFAEAVAKKIQNVKDAFDASLYRPAEAEMGVWLVGNAEKALEQATTYAEADAIELSYLTQIGALKTAAEWEAEEAAKPQDKPEEPDVEEPDVEEPDDQVEEPATGCGSSVVETLVVISMAFACTLVVMMKKKKI